MMPQMPIPGMMPPAGTTDPSQAVQMPMMNMPMMYPGFMNQNPNPNGFNTKSDEK